MINFKIIAFLWVIFLVGCSTTLDFDLQFEGQKLVVFGVLNAKKTIEVTVSHTVPVVGEVDLDATYVSNAEVLLIEDGIVRDTLLFNSSSRRYTSSHTPQFSKSYVIKVCASNYPCVISRPVQLPPTLSIDSFEFEINSIDPVNEGVGTLLLKTISSKFETSRFAIGAYLVHQNQKFTPSNLWDMERPNELSSICGFNYHEMLIYEKGCIGIHEIVQTGLETEIFSEENKINATAEFVDVIIRLLSDDYYSYIISDNNPTGIDRAFQEGSPIYSNIEGGYGYLGAESTIEYTITINQ